MKIAIIGAGIAGNIAFGSLSNYCPEIFEAADKEKTGLSKHKAVMRIRNKEISNILGCDVERIKVHKMVYFKGNLQDKPNIIFNNLYSQKLYNILDFRSINDLGFVDRYLIESDLEIKNMNYNHSFCGLEKNSLIFKGNYDKIKKIQYDICISTIPMPSLINILGINKYKIEFKANSILVYKLKLNIESNIHQTIYFPEFNFSSYRATLEKNVLTIESIEETGDNEVEKILSIFGISSNCIESKIRYLQKFGKIIPIEEDIRRGLIMEITKKFNIFSFGRFAIWKSIRVDNLIDDIDKIKRIIKASNTSREYLLAKDEI